MVDKLSSGMYYSDSYFSENLVEECVNTVETDESINGWDNRD